MAPPPTGRTGRSPAEQALREEAERQSVRASMFAYVTLPRSSTSNGTMDVVAPDDLTHANVMDGSVKYKTLRKIKL
jgi:hypothetical protein